MEQVVDNFIILALLIVAYLQLVDNADRIKESTKWGKKVLCCVVLCSQIDTALVEWTVPKTVDVDFLYFYCIRNK